MNFFKENTSFYYLFWRLFLFFLLLSSIVFSLDSWVFRKFDDESKRKYQDLFNPESVYELIIIGSSSGICSFDTRGIEGFNSTAYNFSYRGANPDFTLEWYRKIFKKHHKNELKTVLWVVHLDMFTESGRKFEGDSANFPISSFFPLLFDGKLSLSHLLLNRLTLVAHQAEIPFMFSNYKPQDPFMMEHYYKGFTPLISKEISFNRDSKEVLQLQEKEVNPDVPEGNLEQIQAFEDLLDELILDGVNVVLVGIPDYLPGLKHRAKSIKQQMQRFHNIAQKRDIPFLNYTSEGLPELKKSFELFYNVRHLNWAGSTIFTHIVENDLEKLWLKNGEAHASSSQIDKHVKNPSSSQETSSFLSISYQALEERFSNPTQSFHSLGRICRNLKQFEKSILYYKKAIEHDPNNPEILSDLASSYMYLKKYTIAIKILQKVIKLDNKSYQAYNNLGSAYYNVKNLAKAEKYFRKALEINPSYSTAYQNIGNIYWVRGEHKKAQQYYLKAGGDNHSH